MGRRTKQTFFQRGKENGQQAYEKMLNIINHQGNENQNHNEISPHTCQKEWLSSKRTQQMSARMWKKGNPCSLLVGM